MLILHIEYCTLKYCNILGYCNNIMYFQFCNTLKFIDSFNNCISFQVNVLYLHHVFHNKRVDKTNM